MDKYIKDVFTDFTDVPNLLDARLANVNLYKKLALGLIILLISGLIVFPSAYFG